MLAYTDILMNVNDTVSSFAYRYYDILHSAASAMRMNTLPSVIAAKRCLRVSHKKESASHFSGRK